MKPGANESLLVIWSMHLVRDKLSYVSCDPCRSRGMWGKIYSLRTVPAWKGTSSPKDTASVERVSKSMHNSQIFSDEQLPWWVFHVVIFFFITIFCYQK